MRRTNSLTVKYGYTRSTLACLVFSMALVAGLFLSKGSFAQVPNMFNYQAVARDGNGNVIASQAISIRISVLNGGPTGTAGYIETHNVTTNQFGLFTLPVGGGSASVGTLASVNWASGNEWLKVEMDVNGGSNYTDMGTTQLLSVPYALVAGKTNAMSINDLTDVDASTAQVGQVLKFNGTDWIPGNDNTTTGSGSGGGTTYIAGKGISISVNNVITNTGDTNPYDDITDTTVAGGDLSGTFPNPAVVAIQGKPVSATAPNAGQVLKFDGTKWAPGTDNASSGGSNYTQGTGISISGSVISTAPLAGDVTGSSTANTVTKIQNISVSNTPPTSGQVLKYNGSTWAPGTDNGGSGGGSYTAGTGIAISGSNVISTDNMNGDVTGTINSNVVTQIQTYPVSPNAPSVGQAMIWNGTQWAPGSVGTGSGTGLWNQSGSNIYNFNGGNVGVGNSSPTALFDVGGSSSLTTVVGQFKNTNAANTSNVLNLSNNGTGYNLYSYKTGQSEAAYFVKDNPNSGTADIYATNNGTGNSIDAFATGTGYAGGFHGGATALGGIYANITGAGYAGYFDGALSGGGILASASGTANAATLNGKVKIQFACITPSIPHLNIYETSASNAARINFQNSSGSSYWSATGLTSNTVANALFGISFSSTGNIMTLTGDGNAGVGINAPAARLHLYGDGNYTGSLAKFETNDPYNSNSVLTINTLSMQSELITATKAGVGYGANIQKTGTQISSAAAIYGASANASGTGVQGSVFGNCGYGVYGNAAGSGSGTNVFYGVYGYGSGSAGADCGVYGVQGSGSNDWAGYFNGNLGYSGLLIGTSDEKLKTNVHPVTGALQSVLALQPKLYEYRHDGDYQYMHLPYDEQVGLIAQDLEKVLPNLVKQSTFTYMKKDDDKTSDDGKLKEGAVSTTTIDYKGVNYLGLIPVLVGAIQEQQKEIEDLKLQLSRLKN